jgi:glutamate-ammonia-ligase adenylyltransferase
VADRQELVVIAMGKLGARELNLSSDIDLIFVYPGERRNRRRKSRSISNEEFFTRLGRALIAPSTRSLPKGFVFRVDMRLRPYGESGPLGAQLRRARGLLPGAGRDWGALCHDQGAARYRLVAVRCASASMRLLQPFVYRRYVDFSAIESLRAMKQLIVAEVRGGARDNVKLGSGGIREVEFIAQCVQLIRGGRDRLLQRASCCRCSTACAELGSCRRRCSRNCSAPTCSCATVRARHAGLGRPPDPGAAGQMKLPLRRRSPTVMGFADWEAFAAALAAASCRRCPSTFRRVSSQSRRAPDADAGQGLCCGGRIATTRTLA